MQHRPGPYIVACMILIGISCSLAYQLGNKQDEYTKIHNDYFDLFNRHVKDGNALEKQYKEALTINEQLSRQLKEREAAVQKLADTNIMLTRVMLGWNRDGRPPDLGNKADVDRLPKVTHPFYPPKD